MVTTGPLKFSVDGNDFNILDTVWYDLNDDGTYTNAERMITPDNGTTTVHGGVLTACHGNGSWKKNGPIRNWPQPFEVTRSCSRARRRVRSIRSPTSYVICLF